MTRLAPQVACWLVLTALTASAQGPMAPVDPLDDWRNRKEREQDAPLNEFRLISYFFTRASVTNMLGDPAGLRGVALGPIGEFAGSSVRVGPNTTSAFLEQRWIPVIEYSPFFVDDLATFRAQFEIDYLWGLAANTTLQNQGGGFNADMVNLQTKNLNVALYPTRKPRELTVLLGTQSFYDNINDPTRTPVSEIVRGGYKLAFLGSDGTGAQIFWSPTPKLKTRAGLLFVGASQPDKALMDDARLKFAVMGLADVSYELMPGTTIGASGWLLRDDTKGAAYAFEGLIFSGPSSSGLSGFTGTARFNMDQPVGTVGFGGLNFQHNPGFHVGRFAASGFVLVNAGRYVTTRATSTNARQIDILGVTANLEALYQWGKTANDLITLEGLYVTGDQDPNDARYTSAFTMNMYGLPGAVWFNHRALLLFPFTSTVNNYTGAIADISNQGLGTTAAIASAAWDVVPNTLNVKVGTALGTANATPAPSLSGVARGRFMGVEVNAEVKWHIRYLMTVGLHGAYMVRGNFYDGNDRVAADPWALFSTFTWYAF